MLNAIVSETLKLFLEEENFKNILYIDCYFSDMRARRILSITKNEELSYNLFVHKTKYLISKDDICSYDDSTIDVDLTDKLIDICLKYVTNTCLNEFQNMNKE